MRNGIGWNAFSLVYQQIRNAAIRVYEGNRIADRFNFDGFYPEYSIPIDTDVFRDYYRLPVYRPSEGVPTMNLSDFRHIGFGDLLPVQDFDNLHSSIGVDESHAVLCIRSRWFSWELVDPEDHILSRNQTRRVYVCAAVTSPPDFDEVRVINNVWDILNFDSLSGDDFYDCLRQIRVNEDDVVHRRFFCRLYPECGISPDDNLSRVNNGLAVNCPAVFEPSLNINDFRDISCRNIISKHDFQLDQSPVGIYKCYCKHCVIGSLINPENRVAAWRYLSRRLNCLPIPSPAKLNPLFKVNDFRDNAFWNALALVNQNIDR